MATDLPQLRCGSAPKSECGLCGCIFSLGIRIAIGARQQSVVWMMVRETLLLVTIGAALGTLASLGVNHFIAAQLFGVTPRDLAAIVVALSVPGCVTLIARHLPARHASRIRSGQGSGLSDARRARPTSSPHPSKARCCD